MDKIKRIAAAIAAILLIFALVGGIISAIVISIPVKAWPVWVVIPGIVALAGFAVPAVVALEKKLIARAKREDVAEG